MKINCEIWQNEVFKGKRKSSKYQTTNYLMNGTSLQGKKLQFIMEDALAGRVMETDTYYLWYGLACSTFK